MLNFKPRFVRCTAISTVVTTAIMSMLAMTPTQLRAQSAGQAALEEVVVTAQKRSESAQTVPISLTAFSGETLESLGVQETRDLPLVTPGLVISQISSAQITLRGVSTSNLNLSGDPGVGVYLDDVYIARASAAFQDFFDTDRIEVLRGPQGTLFGRNTPGGVISIYSRAPSFESDGKLTATYGSEDLLRVEGAFGGAIVDDFLAGRIAFVRERRDGWLTNLFDNDDVDDKDLTSVRIGFRLQPSEAVSMVLRADYSKDKGTGSVFKATKPGLANAIGGVSPIGRRDAINANDRFTKDTRNKGASLRVNWDFAENWTLSSITGYRVHETADTGDLDDTQLQTAYFDNLSYSRTLQQELQVTSTSVEGLDWVAGVFAWWEDADATLDFPFPLFGIRPLTLSDIETFSIAGFFQGSYYVTEKARITAGLRYTKDDKEFVRNFSLIPVFSNAIDTSSRKDSAWTPRVGIDYFFRDDVMGYVNYTRGFKSGGFNGAGRQPNYSPEYVNAVEAGVKSTLLDGRLRLNAAAFHYDYKDVQALRIVQAGSAIDNAASGTIKGGEIELTAAPTERLGLRIGLSYLDARYDEYLTNDPLANNAPVDLTGKTFPRSPEWTVNAAINYTAPLPGGGSLDFGADSQNRSEVFFDQFNRADVGEKSISILNARVTYRDAGGKWRISAYGRNLSDKFYTESRFAIAELGGTVLGVVAPPRNYGLEVGYEF